MKNKFDNRYFMMKKIFLLQRPDYSQKHEEQLPRLGSSAISKY